MPADLPKWFSHFRFRKCSVLCTLWM